MTENLNEQLILRPTTDYMLTTKHALYRVVSVLRTARAEVERAVADYDPDLLDSFELDRIEAFADPVVSRLEKAYQLNESQRIYSRYRTETVRVAKEALYNAHSHLTSVMDLLVSTVGRGDARATWEEAPKLVTAIFKAQRDIDTVRTPEELDAKDSENRRAAIIDSDLLHSDRLSSVTGIPGGTDLARLGTPEVLTVKGYEEEALSLILPQATAAAPAAAWARSSEPDEFVLGFIYDAGLESVADIAERSLVTMAERAFVGNEARAHYIQRTVPSIVRRSFGPENTDRRSSVCARCVQAVKNRFDEVLSGMSAAEMSEMI